MSVWIVPAQLLRRHALPLRGDHVEGEHHRRRGVDRHRGRDRRPWSMPGEQRLHVVERVDRHALAADLALRARVVGVVAHQRRHVERRGEPGLPVVEQVAEALVGLLGGAEAGELPHRPQPAAVHRRVDAARERILAREADPLLERPDVLGRVERRDRLAAERGEQRVALRRCAGSAPGTSARRRSWHAARQPSRQSLGRPIALGGGARGSRRPPARAGKRGRPGEVARAEAAARTRARSTRACRCPRSPPSSGRAAAARRRARRAARARAPSSQVMFAHTGPRQ